MFSFDKSLILSTCFTCRESEIFRLTIDFEDIGGKIREGHNMLFKQQSGNIIELICSSTRPDLMVIPFLWIADFIKDANYLLTREQVESIISDPVVKIRVEYNTGYEDIKLNNKSKLSSYKESAYKDINDALLNK